MCRIIKHCRRYGGLIFHGRSVDNGLLKKTMDTLAQTQDRLLAKMKSARYSPKLNTSRSRQYWLDQPGSPKPERPRPQPKTIAYDQLIKQWQR